jgi:hypothetical protein
MEFEMLWLIEADTEADSDCESDVDWLMLADID